MGARPRPPGGKGAPPDPCTNTTSTSAHLQRGAIAGQVAGWQGLDSLVFPLFRIRTAKPVVNKPLNPKPCSILELLVKLGWAPWSAPMLRAAVLMSYKLSEQPVSLIQPPTDQQTPFLQGSV